MLRVGLRLLLLLLSRKAPGRLLPLPSLVEHAVDVGLERVHLFGGGWFVNAAWLL